MEGGLGERGGYVYFIFTDLPFEILVLTVLGFLVSEEENEYLFMNAYIHICSFLSLVWQKV